MKKNIYFFSHRIAFTVRDKNSLRSWLQRVAAHEKHNIANLNYVFCSDAYLLKLNRKFLGHDFLTDVLTFDHRDVKRRGTPLAADIYISIDRVRDNARTYGVPVADELHRTMVHGLLHLAGYDDKTPARQRRIRAREDEYLSLRSF